MLEAIHGGVFVLLVRMNVPHHRSEAGVSKDRSQRWKGTPGLDHPSCESVSEVVEHKLGAGSTDISACHSVVFNFLQAALRARID